MTRCGKGRTIAFGQKVCMHIDSLDHHLLLYFSDIEFGLGG